MTGFNQLGREKSPVAICSGIGRNSGDISKGDFETDISRFESSRGSTLDDDLKRLVEQDCTSAAHLNVSKALFGQLRQIASQATPKKSTLYDVDLSMLTCRSGATAPARTGT